jgi:hypothetical protein
MKADFTKFLGPLPSDPPKYIEPQGAEPLKDADPATTCLIRRTLAIQEAQRLELERAIAVPERLL